MSVLFQNQYGHHFGGEEVMRPSSCQMNQQYCITVCALVNQYVGKTYDTTSCQLVYVNGTCAMAV